MRGGGYEAYTNVNGYFAPNPYSQAQLVSLGSHTFQRLLPDGTVENFILYDGSRTYLTSIVDPQGNAAVISYDANYRLTSIADAAGNPATTFTYVSNTAGAGFYKVASITDGGGRSASFSYDSTTTFLTSITDSVGIVSQFQYDTSSAFITLMTTPYGATSFFQYTPVGDAANAYSDGPTPPAGLRATFAGKSSNR